MKRRSGTGGEIEAVRRMAEEAARAPVPQVDWQAVEDRLMNRASELPPVPLHGPSRGARVAIVGVAIAAAAAAAFVLRGERAPGGEVATAPAAAAPRVGDVLVSTDAARALDWPGRFHCTLAPGSRVRVASIAPPPEAAGGVESVTLALEAGAIEAEVVPQPRPETFAVEVGRTRVAVHGTAFRVTRADDRATVEVFHGVVAVGEPGRTLTNPAWLLTGPDVGSFSLDGGADARFPTDRPRGGAGATAAPSGAGAAPATTEPGAAASPAGSTAEPAAPPAASAAPRLPATLGRAETAAGLDRIRAGLAACLERQRSGQVRVSIESSLDVTIAPDGTVREARFDPPLSPTLMRCAGDAIAAVRFPRAEGTTRTTLPVRLGN